MGWKFFKRKKTTKKSQEWEAFCKYKEWELKLRGVKHIRYTESGLPLPDWEKIIKEDLQNFKGARE